jgi:hypothetical protein
MQNLGKSDIPNEWDHSDLEASIFLNQAALNFTDIWFLHFVSSASNAPYAVFSTHLPSGKYTEIVIILSV